MIVNADQGLHDAPKVMDDDASWYLAAEWVLDAKVMWFKKVANLITVIHWFLL